MTRRELLVFLALTLAIASALLALLSLVEPPACRTALVSDGPRGRVVVCTDHLTGDRE